MSLVLKGNLILRGNKVAIERLKKQEKAGNLPGFLVMPEDSEYVGNIKFLGQNASSDLKVGQKVYFSTKFQNTRILGIDLCIMDDTEVYGIME